MTNPENNATKLSVTPRPAFATEAESEGRSTQQFERDTEPKNRETMPEDPNSAQTARAQLNEITNHLTVHDEYPEDVSKTDVQDLGQTLHEQLEDRIETYVAETTFTRREAEAWALTKHNKHNRFVTHDAAALLFSTPGTGFGETTGANEETTTSQAVTSEDVEQWVTSANKKVVNAEQTVGAVTFPDRNDVLTNPQLVWLDRHTVQRLQNQHQSGENTLDDIATRVLDETETQRSLEELVRGYLDARGEDNVTQITVDRQSFKIGGLHITAHTDIPKELPDIVAETDAITYHGHRYEFWFDEDPFGPHGTGRITLYASDTIHGMDEVPLKEGLAAADEHMQELLESDEPLPTRTIA